jgi:hypothetical protein
MSIQQKKRQNVRSTALQQMPANAGRQIASERQITPDLP